MSSGRRAKTVRAALETSLVKNVLALDDLERGYLQDVLTLDSLGWDPTKAGELGPAGVLSWEATHRSDGTRIETTTRSALIRQARSSN